MFAHLLDVLIKERRAMISKISGVKIDGTCGAKMGELGGNSVVVPPFRAVLLSKTVALA